MVDPPRKLEDWLRLLAYMAELLAALVAVGAIFVAIVTYRGATEQHRENLRAQTEATATNVLQEHLNLATQHPNLASRQTAKQIVKARYTNPEEVLQGKEESTEARLEPDYVWFASHATFTAESIYNLTKDFETGTWKATVLGLVERHRTYVLNDVFPCEQYSREFVRLLSSDDPLLTESFKHEFSCKPA